MLSKVVTRLPVATATLVATFPPKARHWSLSSVLGIKEIIKKEEGNSIVVSGRHAESPREKYLIPNNPSGSSSSSEVSSQSQDPCPCSLCRLGLHIQHTDVLILHQFVDSKGKRLPRHVTGLCRKQYRRLMYLLVMAEKAGLMDRYTAEGTKRELVGWERFNKYYDESAIEEFVNYTTRRSRA